MKKYLATFVFLLFANLDCFAQSYSPDNLKNKRDELVQSIGRFLTVKGVELKPGMKVKDMYDVLINKGFKKSDSSDYIYDMYGGYALNGTFFGLPNCSLQLLPVTTDKKTLGMVCISFQNQNSFKELKRDYDILKSALGEKYFISKSIEMFDDNYVSESTSDYLKLHALKNKEASFQSTFYLSNNELSVLLGQIILSITCLKLDYQDTCYVSLTYYTSDFVMEQFTYENNDL